jgi:glucose/arabinose dehydrogenase
MTMKSEAAAIAVCLALAACGGPTALDPAEGYGPDPALPEPRSSLLPTVDVADAVGWPQGRTPVAAQGFQVQAFAVGLDHPRWLYRLPNGDILVAETNAPPKPDDKKGGFRGWVQGLFMSRAGAVTPSADRITLLRDADGDGVAEVKTTFLENLTSPFGMALVGGTLYVANADAVVAFPYQTDQTRITVAPRTVTPLPAGRNHHWTKSLVASSDGARLYVGVGSNSNVGERKTAAPPSGRLIRRPARTASTPPACATRSAWPGSLTAANCGLRSMSVTNWAMIWFPTT